MPSELEDCHSDRTEESALFWRAAEQQIPRSFAPRNDKLRLGPLWVRSFKIKNLGVIFASPRFPEAALHWIPTLRTL